MNRGAPKLTNKTAKKKPTVALMTKGMVNRQFEKKGRRSGPKKSNITATIRMSLIIFHTPFF